MARVKASRGSEADSMPRSIGPYNLDRVLGRGGMGVVYRGRHQQSGEPAAIKTVTGPLRRDLQGLRREIRALSQIRHPGIVQILDQGMHQGLPWYAMEYVDGHDLRALRRQAPAEEPLDGERLLKLLTLLRRICSPLAFLHGEGMVHRDLKPGNVILRPDGTPVLVDFGMVMKFAGPAGREALEVTGLMMGTVTYMAPEQIRGEHVDARADLYSLGCLAYELLTGNPPFKSRKAFAVLQAHLAEPPTPPSSRRPSLPEELDALILHLLAKEPRDRLGYAQDLARNLADLGARNGFATGAPQPRAHLYRPGLAGRDAVLLSLMDGIRTLLEGSGGLWLLAGESGVGKTRLALEAAREARMRRVRVLTGASQGGAQETPSLGPLRGALRAILDHCREIGLDETGRLLGGRGRLLQAFEPEMEHLPGLEREPVPAELPPDAARLRLLRAMADTLLDFVGHEPTLLLLDDLQWADELTLDLLELLCRSKRLEQHPLMVLGTCRSGEISERLADLMEQRAAACHVLGRLNRSEMAHVVGDMLALDPAPEGLVRLLEHYSEGNPLFLSEYLRSIVEEGRITRDEQGRWRAVGVEGWNLPIPQTLAELLSRRLRDLSSATTRALESAAVAGRECHARLVERITLLSEWDLLDALNDLERRQILEGAGSDRLRFSHSRIWEVAYQGIAAKRKEALHRMAAEALEEQHETDPSVEPGVVARHWERAGRLDHALGWYRAGARLALERYSLPEAERHFRDALRMAPADSVQQAGLQVELSELVLLKQGRFEQAMDELQAAWLVCRTMDEPGLKARLRRGVAEIESARGNFESARALLAEALGLFRRVGDRREEGRALSHLGKALSDAERRQEARTTLEQALEIHREMEDRTAEGMTLDRLGILLTETGRPDEALAFHEAALAIHRELGNRQHEAVTLSSFAPLLASQGRMKALKRRLEEARAIFREIGYRRFEGRVLANLASAEQELGQLEAAEACCRQALEIHREVGERLWEGIGLLNLGSILLSRKRPAEAAVELEASLAILEETGARSSEGVARYNLGNARTSLGQYEPARAAYEKAAETLREAQHEYYEALNLMAWARLERWMGADLDAAGERARQALEKFRKLENPLMIAACLGELGHATLARGESPGEDLLEEIQAMASRTERGPDILRQIEDFQRSWMAHRRGRPLHRGEAPVNLPEGVREALGLED